MQKKKYKYYMFIHKSKNYYLREELWIMNEVSKNMHRNYTI